MSNGNVPKRKYQLRALHEALPDGSAYSVGSAESCAKKMAEVGKRARQRGESDNKILVKKIL